MSSKALGVIGGMGALATIEFLNIAYSMLSDVPEKHMRNLFVDISTDTPSRTLAYLGRGESPLASLLERVIKFQELGIRKIYLPCNSVHLWRDEVVSETGVNWPSIVEVSAEAVRKKNIKNNPKVLILGSAVTVGSDMYGKKMKCTYLSDQVQSELESAILNFKNGGLNAYSMVQSVMDEIRSISPDIIVNACTELKFFSELFEAGFPVVDSNTEYAKSLAADLKVR